MNTNDVIESYVTDVALRLPRRERNDVALELRELLTEELRGMAEEAGRAVDVAMAIEFLRAFGRPEDVAARYRPALTIIDPADGQAFLRATVIGLAIIWGLGLVQEILEAQTSGNMLGNLGQWWTETVIPSLWWPGVLVVYFGLAAWARARWPQASRWTPRAEDRVGGGRGAQVLGLIGILCGLWVLIDPRGALEWVSRGQMAPAALAAFEYTESFLR